MKMKRNGAYMKAKKELHFCSSFLFALMREKGDLVVRLLIR